MKLLQDLSSNKEEKSALTLSKLSSRIKENLTAGFPDQFWIIAEISELHLNNSGHAYLELVEKNPATNKILARMRATIWSYSYRMLRPYFEGSTGYQLSAGIKVLVNVSLEYHSLYSLSLNIKDIDPKYTLGDLAKRKAEIIERLTREGIMDMNQQIVFPLVPQRIAVISSPTAAGFEDFLNTLSSNIYNFHFEISLFRAVMQGEKAEISIIEALEKIYESEENYDVVVIIRGGGASIELDCFNNYDLAFHITQFPLPILTGIGHERDETVADLVSFKKLKTPTAVSEFLIDRMVEFINRVERAEEHVSLLVKNKIQAETEKISWYSQNLILHTREALYHEGTNLNNIVHELRAGLNTSLSNTQNDLRERINLLKFQVSKLISKEKQKMELALQKLNTSVYHRLKEEKERLTSLQKISGLFNPEYILSRGYSITTHEGKILKDAGKVQKDDELITVLHKGKIKSKVK